MTRSWIIILFLIFCIFPIRTYATSSTVAEPVITNSGTGCDDGLCLWAVVSNLSTNYSVLLRDPKNFSTTFAIFSENINRSSTGISFKIPTSAISIFNDRGLDLVITNIGIPSKSWHVIIKKVARVPSSPTNSVGASNLSSNSNSVTPMAPELPQVPIEPAKYFGYYWGQNNASAFANYSNATFVSNEWTYNESDVIFLADMDIASIKKLKGLGLKSIIDVSGVLFNMQTDDSLRSDWQNRWNQYWARIYPYLSDVIAIYPHDEPSASQINSVASIIKTSTDSYQSASGKHIHILAVLTADAVMQIQNGSYTVPSEVDWVGFDEYGCWSTDCYQGVSIPDKLKILTNNYPLKKIVVIGDGSVQSASVPTIDEQNIMAARDQNYANLCNSTKQCVGMFVFMYSSLSGMIGVNQMPTLESTLALIGKNFLKQLNPPEVVAEPVITNSGTGCTDGLCIWAVVPNLSSNFNILIRDPKNFATSYPIPLGEITRNKTGISFRIPSVALPIFNDRGLDLVITNIGTSFFKSWHVNIKKVGM